MKCKMYGHVSLNPTVSAYHKDAAAVTIILYAKLPLKFKHCKLYVHKLYEQFGISRETSS